MEENRKRILLVDDEGTFTNALKFYLEKTGRFIVQAENNGQNAFAAAKAFKPDLILLDMIMPEIDGGTIAAQLKADADLNQVPVLFLTAAVSREEATTRSGLVGGKLFIAKPVSAKEVLAHLDFYLQKDGPAGTRSGRSLAT